MSEDQDKWEIGLLVRVEVDRSEAHDALTAVGKPIINQSVLHRLDDLLREASLDVADVKVSLRGIDGQEPTAYLEVVAQIAEDSEGNPDLIETALDGIRQESLELAQRIEFAAIRAGLTTV